MINGLGERLQKQRLALKLSQREVAKALNASASVISNYESGERTPSIEALMSLADLYRCSIDYLLGIEKTDCINCVDTSMLTANQKSLLQMFLESLK